MKLAVLADIHSNQYALLAVVNKLKYSKIDKVIILGDFIGYYYGIAEVFKLLEGFSVLAVKGNHEEMYFENINDESEYLKLKGKYGSSYDYIRSDLTSNQIDFLKNLPPTLELEIDDKKLLFCHGSPWLIDQYVYPDAPIDLLRGFKDYDYDIFFCGHTHYQAKLNFESKLIYNPGSVGQSREKGGYAFWGILNTATWDFQFMKTCYNKSQLIRECISNDPLLDYNVNVLNR